MKLEFPQQICEKYKYITFLKFLPVGAELFHAKGRTDRQKNRGTDRYTEGQTDTQRDRQIHRGTDRYTEGQT